MKKLLFILLTINLTTSCTGQAMKDLKPVENVDIQRFMGKWYVIAIKPNWIEKNPFNSIEEYSLKSQFCPEYIGLMLQRLRKGNPVSRRY